MIQLFVGSVALGSVDQATQVIPRATKTLRNSRTVETSRFQFKRAFCLFDLITSHRRQVSDRSDSRKGGAGIQTPRPALADTGRPHSFHKRQEFRN